MDVEVPLGEVLGYRVHWAEVHHVERAERDNLGESERAGSFEAVGAGREHTADQLVRQLGRYVEDAREEAAPGERLHRTDRPFPWHGRRAPRSRALPAAPAPPSRRASSTLNIVAPINGFSPPTAGTRLRTAPAIIPAAFVMICAEIRLTPAMSTTEYIIAMSTAPTYGRVSPDATVDTIRLGTPAGSARIACVTIDELRTRLRRGCRRVDLPLGYAERQRLLRRPSS